MVTIMTVTKTISPDVEELTAGPWGTLISFKHMLFLYNLLSNSMGWTLVLHFSREETETLSSRNLLEAEECNSRAGS